MRKEMEELRRELEQLRGEIRRSPVSNEEANNKVRVLYFYNDISSYLSWSYEMHKSGWGFYYSFLNRNS